MIAKSKKKKALTPVEKLARLTLRVRKAEDDIETLRARMRELADMRETLTAHAALIGDIGHRFRVITGYPDDEYGPRQIRQFTENELKWIRDEELRRKREGIKTGVWPGPETPKRKRP